MASLRLNGGINRGSRGFSLFELVVFIISVAIIYAAAARRFSDFPGEAERANFLAVTTQIQSSITLEAMLSLSRDGANNIAAYVNSNPMDMLLEPPRNYIGLIDSANATNLDRRIWYFDPQTRELVYLANDSDNLYHVIGESRVPATEIRFVVSAEYVYRDKSTGVPVSLTNLSSDYSEQYEKKFSGLLLKPVIPFDWQTGPLDQNV